MTLRELCKTAANGQIQGPQPTVRNMKTDQYGNTRWTWTVPNRGADKQTVADWENQRKADLQRQNPGIDLEANKDRWHLETIWNNYDSQARVGQDTINKEMPGVVWWDPTTWFADRDKAQRRIAQGPSDAAKRDPVQMYMERGRTQGHGQGAQYRETEAARDAAELTQWLPYFTPELGEYVAGNLGVEGNASNWQDTRDTRMQEQDYADSLRRNYGMNGDQIAQRIDQLGKVMYVDPNDPNLGEYAGYINAGQDLAREIFGRGFLLNTMAPGIAGAVGKVPVLGRGGAWLAAHPRMAQAVSIGGQVGTMAAPNLLNMSGHPTLALFTGMDPVRADEANAGYLGLEGQKAYNAAMFTDGDGSNPFSYSQYVDWGIRNFVNDPEIQAMAQNGATPEQLDPLFAQWMQDPATNYKFIEAMAEHGTGSYNLLKTPMFQNLTPADKVGLFRKMLESRITYVGKGPTLIENALGRWLQNKPIGEKLGISGYSDPEILSYMIEHDRTGSLRNLTETFIAYSDPESVNMLLGGSGAGGAKINPEKLTGLFNTFENGFCSRIKDDPQNALMNIRGLMNLQNARGSQDGNTDEVASTALQSIRRGILRGMTEKTSVMGENGHTLNLDAIDMMSDKQLQQLADMFKNVGKSKSVTASMSSEDLALQNAVTRKITGRLANAFFSDPMKNGPITASLFFNSMGLTGLSEMAANPMIFWSTAALLLAGGVIVASNVFDDDDEDDEEEEEEKRFRKALRRDPYR